MIKRFLLIALTFLTPHTSEATTIKFDTSSLSAGQKILSKFYIEGLLPWNFQGKKITETSIEVDCTTLTANACSIINEMSDPSGHLDYANAQKVWMLNYLETREQRNNHEIIPDTLEELMALSNYRTWPNFSVDSRVKRAKRVIYQGRLDGRRVSIAETWSDDQILRETELAVEAKREKGTFDFYVYLHDGKIALESEFPAGMRPAPLICVSCHMNGSNQKTDRFISNNQ